MTDAPTTRERVAHLIDQGLSVREIAAILNVSTQAIYKHLKRIEADRTEAGAA